MKKEYTYVRPKAIKGEHPTYTFISISNGVNVIRENDGDTFEHIFRKGDVVQQRTLKEFHWNDEDNISVYASSEEFNDSNCQSLANQIDLIYFDSRDQTITSELELIKVVSNDLNESFKEGCSTSVWVKKYERNSQARKIAIDHHGCICAACKFDFSVTYGNRGAGFIHVHHIVPLSEITEEYKVNPRKDLIPVCPNCHSMLHRTKEALSIKALKEIMNCLT